MDNSKIRLPKKADDISKWYLDLVQLAELADYGPARGTMVIRPYAYAIWENTQKVLDEWFKEEGVQNAYFPLFIPRSLLDKEKDHIEGFDPELAIVTHGGGEKLAEPLVVRPTSEVIINEMFRKWVSSYKDLPMKVNQWVNVVRWEKRTYPFLRTLEFLWQEGHTIHTTKEEAMEMTLKALEWYRRFFEEYFALSTYVGEKSGSEKFAGADRTFTIEIVMPDGRALQSATSHFLGQNFTRSFNVQYSNENNKLTYPYQTSWGLSTRALGGLIMAHGDDNGLILPPKIAPYQVVIIAINSKDESSQGKINAYIRTIEGALRKESIRYITDSDNEKSLGFRMNEAEIKGIPIRLIVGTDEYENKYVTASRRDDQKKLKLQMTGLASSIQNMMIDMHSDMLARSQAMKENLTVDCDSFEEFKEIMENDRKFVRAYWDESATTEAKIKEITKATTRLIEFDHIKDNEDGTCIYSGNKARRKWLFARSY